jgi:lysozyme family protein
MAFEDTVNHIINFEGGYVDDPRDPGGATKYGISSTFLRSIGDNTDPRDLTRDKAKEYYKVYFWDVLACEQIQSNKVQLILFDTAINMGVQSAIRILQKSLRIFAPITVDGIAGPQTTSILSVAQANAGNLAILIDAFLTIRKQTYIDISIKRNDRTFLRGWFKRVNQLARIIEKEKNV